MFRLIVLFLLLTTPSIGYAYDLHYMKNTTLDIIIDEETGCQYLYHRNFLIPRYNNFGLVSCNNSQELLEIMIKED